MILHFTVIVNKTVSIAFLPLPTAHLPCLISANVCKQNGYNGDILKIHLHYPILVQLLSFIGGRDWPYDVQPILTVNQKKC